MKTLLEIVRPDSSAEVTADVLRTYASAFGKTYANEEESHRALENLKLSVTRIRDLNRGKHGSATFGLNRFSDVHPADFGAFYLNFESSNDVSAKALSATSTRASLESTPFESDLKGSFDWRTVKGVVSAVKNQQRCGSCWAFSAVETVESAFVLAGNEPRVLSTEQVVACDNLANGCTGGNSNRAYMYIQSVGGLLSQNDYPDTSSAAGRTGYCEIGTTVTNDTMTSPLVEIDSYRYTIPPCTDLVSCDGQKKYEANLRHFGSDSIERAATIRRKGATWSRGKSGARPDFFRERTCTWQNSLRRSVWKAPPSHFDFPRFRYTKSS